MDIMRIFLLLWLAMTAHASISQAETIHILVWDEQQNRKKEPCDSFRSNEIEKRFAESIDDFEIRSVSKGSPKHA